MGTVELQIDAGGRDDAPADADFVLAHLSDPHLSPLEGVSPRALLGKRILGYVSWRLRRRREHRADVLDALRADLQAARLDHIAVTGDLTHLGLPQEFREAAAWLARLSPPEGITVVPGGLSSPLDDDESSDGEDDPFALPAPRPSVGPRAPLSAANSCATATTSCRPPRRRSRTVSRTTAP